jgi:hypothetical protein
MNNIVLLFVCLLLGMLLRITHRIPDNSHNSLNAFIIHISLPALIMVPSGMWLGFAEAHSPGNMKVSVQAARSIG